MPDSPLILKLYLRRTLRILVDVLAALVWALEEEGLNLHWIWARLVMVARVTVRRDTLQGIASV